MAGGHDDNQGPDLPDPRNVTSLRIRRAIAGDGESTAWIVAHFDPLVEAQVRLRLGAVRPAPDAVRELVHEVWLVTLKKLKTLRPREGRFAPVLSRFLTTTSVYLCNNHLRSLIRRRKLDRSPPAPADTEAPPTMDRLEASGDGVETKSRHREITEAVARALDSLSEEKRNLLVLRLVENRTNAEIAEMLGILPNTVAVRYRRALEELRAALPRPVFGEIRRLRSVAI